MSVHALSYGITISTFCLPEIEPQVLFASEHNKFFIALKKKMIKAVYTNIQMVTI